MVPLVLAMRRGRGILADALLVPQHSFTDRRSAAQSETHGERSKSRHSVSAALAVYETTSSRAFPRPNVVDTARLLYHRHPAAYRNSMLARAHRVGVCGED
jgi:hypothetical protein